MVKLSSGFSTKLSKNTKNDFERYIPIGKSKLKIWDRRWWKPLFSVRTKSTDSLKQCDVETRNVPRTVKKMTLECHYFMFLMCQTTFLS